MSEITPVLVSTLRMHTHRCEACAAKGKEVVWIHPDADRGQIAAHRCPECGTVNWKQSTVDNAKLPQPQPTQTPTSKVDVILGYVLIFVALGLIGYCGYVIYQRKKVPALA